MRLTHILVDFDNKQPPIAELALVSGATQRLWIFTSPHSAKFTSDYVDELLAHPGRAKLVRCTKAGNNAVDLHIALHIGRLIADRAAGGAAEGGDEFVVVSADKDFVPVLEFVRRLGYAVRQVKTLKDAVGTVKKPARSGAGTATPVAKTATKAAAKAAAKPAAPKKATSKPRAGTQGHLEAVIEALQKSPKNRPATVATLGKWLIARQLPEGEVKAAIAGLASAKVLQVDGKRVIYAPEPWPAKR